jgi:hypothetical protein
MVTRRPLVLDNGLFSELLDGDTINPGAVTTSVVAGSGLSGGGAATSNSRLDLALAPNPSGVIYVGDSIGLDGQTLVVANDALASGNAAIGMAFNALASGNDSLVVASAALASGNSALALSSTFAGGSVQTTLTAASAVASGYVVGVDDAGRVQAVRSTVIDKTNPIIFPSSPSNFTFSGSTYDISAAYSPVSQKIVIAYTNGQNSNYGTALVATVSGTSISVGTPIVFNSTSTTYNTTVYDPVNEKFIISYRSFAGGLNNGYSLVGTVSGTTISFGSPVSFEAGAVTYISRVYDRTNSKVILSYADDGNSSYGTAVVGTVSGSSISFGTAVVFESASVLYTSTTHDLSNNKIVITYSSPNSLFYGKGVVGTVSGTSISFGTAVTFRTASTGYHSCVYDSSNNRIVNSYVDVSNSSYGTSIVGTVSGTSISFGTSVVFRSATVSYTSAVYDSASARTVAAYQDGGNSYLGGASVGTVSGTSISFGAVASFNTTAAYFISTVYDSVNNKVVILYSDQSSFVGEAIVADTLLSISYFPTLNSYPNVLGVAQSTVASGASCLINLPGSLYNNPAADYTVGAFYYANPTTSGVTTTATKPSSWNGQVPWNYIGRAVTSSGLMLLKSV